MIVCLKYSHQIGENFFIVQNKNHIWMWKFLWRNKKNSSLSSFFSCHKVHSAMRNECLWHWSCIFHFLLVIFYFFRDFKYFSFHSRFIDVRVCAKKISSHSCVIIRIIFAHFLLNQKFLECAKKKWEMP